MNKNKAVVLAKLEAGGYGVDPTPTTALNAIFCEEPEIEPIVKTLERNHVRQTYGNVLPIRVGEGMKLSFKVELAGSGALGIAPHIGSLLRACNLVETINAGVSVVYDPTSDGDGGESVTIYFYRHNLEHKITGCRGTFKLETKTNEVAKLSFEFTGLYAGPTDVALPTDPVYPTVLPPIFRSASLALDGYAAVIDAFSLDLGNSITSRPDANSATGILEYYVSDRKVSGEIDPEAVALATKDFWSMWQASLAVAFTATIGQVAANRCVVAGPKVAIDDLKYGDRDNRLTYAMPLMFTPDSGDDEVSFTFN